MSEENIVNRVQQTSHFAAEGEKLSAIEVVDVSSTEFQNHPEPRLANTVADNGKVIQVPNKAYVAETMKRLGVPQTAEASRVGQVGSIEEPDDNIGNSMVDVESLRRVLSLTIGGEQPESFTQFRVKVISAFRHMGLDTRRFFQE